MRIATRKGRLRQNTKGLTSVNRLRQVDNFVRIEFAYLFRSNNPIFVDVGFGENPVTTIESYRRFRFINPDIKVIGVEIDNKRLQSAKPYEQTRVEFRLGGFNLPLYKEEKANVIRCYNVLRQYPESDFQPSIVILSNYLIDGGILIEGTSDQFGRLVSFNIFYKLRNEIYTIASCSAQISTSIFILGIFKVFYPETLYNMLHMVIGYISFLMIG